MRSLKQSLRSLVLLSLSGCLAVPLAPVAHDPNSVVNLERFEIDTRECEHEASFRGLSRELKPREWTLPIILAGGGLSLGMTLEYGTVLNPSSDPRHDGQVLLGLVAGGLLIGSIIAAVSVWTRTHASDHYVRECLTARGYDLRR